LAEDFEQLGDLESLSVLTTKQEPYLEVTADLEGRFNFMTRLAALKADVKELDTKAEKEGIGRLRKSQLDHQIEALCPLSASMYR